MGSLTILVPGPAPSPHRQVTITTVDGRLSYTVPLLRAVGLENLAARWADFPRPARIPLGAHAGPGAPTASLEIVCGGVDLSRSCEREIQTLFAMANGDQPVIVTVGQLSRYTPTGTWTITDMAIGDHELVQGSNEYARAEVTLTMRAALTPAQALSKGF